MSGDNTWSHMSRGADMLRLIGEGLVKAGARDAETELLRIINQPGLGDALGKLIMSTLFEEVYDFVCEIEWDKSVPELLLRNNMRRLTRNEKLDTETCDAEFFNFGRALVGTDILRHYRVFKVNRPFHLVAEASLLLLLPHRCRPKPMELMETHRFHHMPKGNPKVVIADSWHFRGFTPYVTIREPGLGFLYHDEEMVEAGTLFLTRDTI